MFCKALKHIDLQTNNPELVENENRKTSKAKLALRKYYVSVRRRKKPISEPLFNKSSNCKSTEMKQQSHRLSLRLNALAPSSSISKLLIPSLSSRPSLSLPSRPFLNPNFLRRSDAAPSRFVCRANNHSSDMISQLELGKPDQRQKPEKQVNGIFWILLLNIGIYVADHVFQVRWVKSLYLYHNWPASYQFVTATFCHFNWNHLSSNLFFLYIFGKLVEEEEGNFALWLSYILTGAGANLVSWLILPRNAVSVGASGAVFGLFAVSVLVKVMEAAQASTGLGGGFRGANALQGVNHIAHLSGALIGVALIWLLSRVSSPLSDVNPSTSQSRKMN